MFKAHVCPIGRLGPSGVRSRATWPNTPDAVFSRIDRSTEILSLGPLSGWNFGVIYKGVQYSVAPSVDPDVWQWQFQIGDDVRSGKTRTRLAAMAARRVQSKIDAALKGAGGVAPAGRKDDSPDA